MKKIFSFTKKKKHSHGTPDNGSVLSAGYDLKDKDLGKVHKAALQGDLAKLKQLAKKNDINQLDKENRTALHIACASGHVEVVHFLVESKAKLNLCDNQNRSALMKAVQGQHERCVNILLENHADPNLVDINGNTALHLAANIPSLSIAVLLLQHGAEINAQNKEGFTPLAVAVREDHIEMAEFLLKESADVNSTDQDQRSPLMLAAGNGQISMVKLLLQFHADITLKDAKGWPADDYAVMNGHHPCSLLIIEHGTQRNDGASASRQGPIKKKKMLGSPSRDVEAGFSLGGPATDKDDFEDISQSESLSRVSKSAADEWPSSEDEDESVLLEKKPLKVNLSKMIGTKKGQDSSAENGQRSSNKRSDSQEESSAEEDSEEEDGEEEEDDEEEEEEEEDDEEEEEEDEDDEEEEDDEEGSEEQEEEDGSVEEDDSSVAAVHADTADPDGLLQPSVTAALKISKCADAQSSHSTPNTGASLGVGDKKDDTAEENVNAETEKDATDVETYGPPATLDLTEDCVVSAIRVESKFSDEDESLGKELLTSHRNISNQSSVEGESPSKTPTPLPSEAKEEKSESEVEKDNDDSWKKHDSSDEMWNDSENEEDNKTEGRGRSTLIASQRDVFDKANVENPDCESVEDPGSHDKGEKRTSSWGSSLEGSDTELPKEENNEIVAQENKVHAQDLLANDTSLPSITEIPPKKDQPDSSWDSSSAMAASTKCVSPKLAADVHKSFAGASLTGSPHSKSRPGTATAEQSDWDSSQNNDSKLGDTAAVNTREQQKCSWEEEDGESIEKESSDPSPVVSAVPKDENTTKIQTLSDEDEDVKPDAQQMGGNSDTENEKEDSSWDDDNNSDDSEKLEAKKTSHSSPTSVHSLKVGNVEGNKVAEKPKTDDEENDGDNKVVPQTTIDGNDESPQKMKPKEGKTAADEYSQSKDDESSEDSDSKHQNLQYDFVSATVKTLDVRDDFSEAADGRLCDGGNLVDDTQARLTAYVPLKNPSTIVTKTKEPSEDPNEDLMQGNLFSNPSTRDDDTGSQHNGSDIDPLSDEVLPQTDIDDVDVDSPDEADSTRWRVLRNFEDPGMQKEDSTEDEEEENEEEELEEAEEEDDVLDKNDPPEDGSESPVATPLVPEVEVCRDKKRDFLSELGLEEGEEEEDSWDSESNSENSGMPHEEKQGLPNETQEALIVTEAVKENLLYVPSFLRKGGDSRMAELEPRRSVGRPKDSQGEAGNNSNGNNEGAPVHRDEPPVRENDKAKWEPVLRKHEGDVDQSKDLMEELGLGDVDDLEDASDWDSASTASKRTLPGRRMASPGLEEFPDCSTSYVNKKEDNVALPAPQSSISSVRKLPGTPSKSAPQPQPRVRKMVHQKPESEEESDWESDKITSPGKMSPTDNQFRNIAEPPIKADSPELSPKAEYTKSNLELVEQQEEKDDAVDRCELDLNNLGQVEDDLRGQCGPENRVGGSDGVPWEKRYEKLWVEVEKKEVKSTFKSVAGELKARFGELFGSKDPADQAREEATSAYTSGEEDSSDEEEGEVIVRPTARARSTVLITIPEQRESGLEDSVTESPDNSIFEERMQDREQPAGDSSSCCQEPEDDFQSASPQLATAQDESTDGIKHSAKAVSGDNTKPVYVADESSFLKDDSKQHIDQNSKAEASRNGSEDTFPAPVTSQLPLQTGHPAVIDEELEGDAERFKLQEGKETAKTEMEVEQSSASWDSGGTADEDGGSEKPETVFGCLSSPAVGIHQQKRPVATKSTIMAPVQLHHPVQQSFNSQEQETQAVKELVRGARRSGAPQTKAHVNGDPLSVFDDSSLSDVSDDEGRLQNHGQQKIKNPNELDMGEDFDELTQSSDTATDDNDSPASGYRHASLLIQKLDSATLDATSIAKLQNIFHEYERSIQKARSRHGYLSDKANQLEMERAELKSSLEEVKEVKSVLERNQLELQTEVTNLKFQLKQEQENRRNASMMYNSSKDKLRRTEEQYQLEVQEKQKVELTLRNMELEMRTLISNMKQLEEDHSETQRLLAQERSARTLQENLLSSHLRKQQEIEEENKRNMSKSNEALSQLTEASDREKELLQQISALQEQLAVLRTDLERSQANSSLKENHLLEENEALKEQLEDCRRDLKLSNDAVAQTVFSYNNQQTTLKSELAVATTRLENERHAREALEVEIESTRSRLAGAVKEAELRLAAHSETEKGLLREREDHQRLKDRVSAEAASQREVVNSISQKLSKAEAHANSMENELHRVTLQLTEKGLLLEVLQREKDQAAARVKELETTLQAEREMVSRAGARQEAAQERLAQAQSESMLLRQQLEEAQNKGVAKERAVTDAQERFSDIVSKLRSDCEERVQLVEDRNKELAGKAADLRDQIYKLEEEKNQRETHLRQLQQELADSLKKLSMSEASLEVNTRYRNDLEEEKTRLVKDLERLRGKLDESEDQYIQAERRINSLKSSLDEREKELAGAAQKLQEALSASAASAITTKQLEEVVQKLEIENARLEAAAKQQSNRIDALQKGAQEAAMVRGRLEDLVTNLQSTKMTLEDQLSREVQKQSMLSHTAQDSQALWEEELKSRSKLGLRLAELEKEKGELSTQMDIEKKKAKKITEQKKAVDTRLDQEMKRNAELQKEMYRLRTLLKTAKKKLRDQDAVGAEFGSPVNSLRMDLGRHSQADGGFGRIKDKVDDLQAQLQKETSRRSQLERANMELKDQMASLKSLSHSTEQLERSKRQLEEEVLNLRRRMEAAQVDQNNAEQFRREAEERARHEVQQKLEQVNLFLQSQAASQEALDQIKSANEANLRSQLEHKICELEGELGRARTTQQDSLNQRESTRTELERYQQLYAEELRLRKSLAAKLERANSRLAEANSKLLSERSRSLITGNITNGSLMAPPLEMGSLGSPANYGATLGPLNRSLGLGLSLISPGTEGHSSRVEDYLAKMQSELDRNISKELSNATAELDAASARMSPVGSASRVELDPLSRATQQYLEVLKKNNRI